MTMLDGVELDLAVVVEEGGEAKLSTAKKAIRPTTLNRRADLCLFLHLSDNAAQRRAQRLGYSGHVYQSDIACSSLYISDISSMYSRKFR